MNASMAHSQVLVISPLMPYPDDEGRKRRQWAIIRALAKRFSVTLVVFGDPKADAKPLKRQEIAKEIVVLDRNEAYGRQRAKSRLMRHLDYWFSVKPWLVRERASLQLQQWLSRQATTPWLAVLVFNVPITGNVLSWLKPWKKRRIPVLVDSDDCESTKQRRLYQSLPVSFGRFKQWVEWVKVCYYEKHWLSRFSQVWYCHEADAKVLEKRGCHNAVVVPNTVAIPPLTPSTDQWDCVFIGMMGYVANVDAVLWFLETTWPRIRAAKPDATFAIVGKLPTPEIRAWHDREGVTVTGEVPDANAYFRKAKISIIPMRLGGGTRIKALDAFAAGAAVVSTSVGVEGFALADSQEVLVADAPEAFASACLRLLKDDQARERLGQAARRLVEQRYTHAALEGRLAQLIPIKACQ